MITIFALPKPFRREFNVIQRNAIKSWLTLEPKPEVILFEDEEGTTKKIAEEFNTIYVPNVKKNEYGTPLINDIFETAQQIAKNNILCYVNADIILMSDFMKAVGKVKDEENFLMVGQRWGLNFNEEIDFNDKNWEEQLKKELINKGQLHGLEVIDYFVFKKGLFKDIPSFAVGRATWDNWFLWKAWKEGAKVINVTKIVTAIHQNHLYIDRSGKQFNPGKTKEAKINLKLVGGYGHCLTIGDSTHILTEEGLEKCPRMNLIRRLELVEYLGVFIRQRRKIIKLINSLVK
jgi:hypothetical protein